MKKAIIFPANPNRKFLGGQDEGSIAAHDDKIRELGSVFWRLMSRGDWVAGEFPHSEIRRGYIYDTSKKLVTHTCDISWIKPMSDVSYDESRQYFLERFDNQEHYNDISEAFYVLNITAIRPLTQPRSFREFLKYQNGEPIKLIRNYCIVQDPEY